jgi:hypothetical protein
MPFLDSLDIANRALFHLGESKIASVSEDSKQNTVMTDAYDKARPAELRRNVWRFSIKRAALRPLTLSTRFLDPVAWSATTTYLPGSVVKDANGDFWISGLAGNINNEPGVSDAWDQYFGPVTADLHDATVTYFAGELVYTVVGTGGFVVWLSLQSSNEDVPGTALAWDTTTTYGLDDVVSYGGFQWRSLITLNTGTTPAVAPNDWSSVTTYTTGNTVTASDGYIYSSVGTGNLNHDPSLDDGTYWTNTGVPTAWAKTPTIYASSPKWRPLYANLTNLSFTWPIGTGPSSQTGSKNIYRLPANWLREAPQNPKQGSYSMLGAPSGAGYSDWDYEGDYFTSMDGGVVIYRFAADVTVVTKMDPLFCEGLACRMALDSANVLTQQDSKFQQAGTLYKTFMGEARTINAIEEGPTEPPEDDYITARR